MTQQLLAYCSSEFVSADVAAIEELASKMEAFGRWTLGAPWFVDATDDASCTLPEDAPIRTVGLVLEVSSPGETPATPVEEVVRFLDVIAELSKRRSVEFEVQLDDVYAGTILDGDLDELLRRALIEKW